jgi:uncharacterized membrane protein YdbT with pleckstrin-like domain
MAENNTAPEAGPRPDAGPETTVWKGPSSQARFFGVYLLCLLFCWLIVPIFIALWKYLENRCRVYEITTERIRQTSGVFSKVSEQLELYRVEDIKVIQPFWFRLFGVGNITLTTNDASTPTVTLEAVPNIDTLRESLRKSVENCRDRKRVRLTEIE